MNRRYSAWKAFEMGKWYNPEAISKITRENEEYWEARTPHPWANVSTSGKHDGFHCVVESFTSLKNWNGRVFLSDDVCVAQFVKNGRSKYNNQDNYPINYLSEAQIKAVNALESFVKTLV